MEDLTAERPDGAEVSMFVQEELLLSSVHRSNTCVSCHADLTEAHPDDGASAEPVQCAGCHEEEARVYDASIHGVSHVLPASNPNSPVFKMNLERTCAQCHSHPATTQEYRLRYPQVASQYHDSIHGRALSDMGLIVAPSCSDCHGVHDIKRSIDRSSPIHQTHVAQTCGRCHVGVEAIYDRSVHGVLLALGDPLGPVCTDCHTAHEIEKPKNGHFKQVSDQRCGQCHEESLQRYHDTYHGKAMALGNPNQATEVAACYDCHGHHDILPPSNPESRLSSDNIVATCGQCHPNATPGFTQYIPHANPRDGEKYPALHLAFVFMTSLLLGVFAFFGAHTLLWLGRSLFLYFSDSKTYRETKQRTQTCTEWYTRFSPFERFLHFLVVTSFLLLVITGMPLKFYYTEWAKVMFGFIGGAQAARTLHRFGAVVTFLYFGLHLASLGVAAWRGRSVLRDPQTGRWRWRRLMRTVFGPDSMVPTLQDVKDFWAHQRWFFGRGQKPQFDRWTYWEKFDYFAVFWGVFIIGASGLVMWFPQFFTRFLPGWVINIALIVHSDEALLAAGFIFTVHFFNTHFRLEKFPMDTVIFSGRVSRTELEHERRRWYARLVAEGRLEDYRVKDEWLRWKKIARPVGFILFGTGLFLLALILYAMGRHLAG
jgi:cytochrome b subunit of formate dehydrogenase